jgi:lipid II isoglutaminyl synthase (glutamine-hydrolysing)
VSDLTLVHLYPRSMNIYGDTGNLLCLRRRLEWRGLRVTVEHVDVGDRSELAAADIVVAGGGEDRAQMEVAGDLLARRAEVHDAVAAGVVFLTVCGTYQLFGRRFVTASGDEVPGIGVFDAETRGGGSRLIGNVLVDSPWGRLVGFENHSGRTILDAGQVSLGTVRRGYGNNDTTSDEGAVRVNCFGTYLHGSVLPKNPGLADELIRRAIHRRDPGAVLEPLDDTIEHAAAEAAASRP